LRVAVSGSHGVGKSTLIASLLNQHPEYAHEPEAFEVLGDDIDITESGAPTAEGLRRLLEYTVSAVECRATQAHVVFERSPVDYLGYAAASGGAWPQGEIERFLAAQTPIVRASVVNLDLIAYLPLPSARPVGRPGETKAFRRRVDACLRRALLDDAYEIFPDRRSPRVVSLPSTPERQLGVLSRLLQGDG